MAEHADELKRSAVDLRPKILLRKTCGCGRPMGPSGSCAECKRKRQLGGALQTKLQVNQPGDRYEQEADKVAEQVMQRQAEDDEDEEELLQTKPLVQRRIASDGKNNEAPPVVQEVLHSSGRPLEQASRTFMESRFGRDFSGVRIHTDSRASAAARSVRAKAFTVGRDIVFNSGEFAPNSSSGQRLLAHELAHVVQQMASGARSRLQRKIDFEFDLNYGTERSAPATSSSANGARLWDKAPITKHRRKSASGAIKDGFKVVQDGNRMEITTKRFALGSKRRSDLTATMNNIMGFVGELENGCKSNSSPPSIARPADSVAPGDKRMGRPRYFRNSFSIDPGRVFVPLGRSKSQPYFSPDCRVFASPQATMDVQLSSVDELVSEIKSTKGKAPGVALTGPSNRRAGVRSDALFHAQKTVNRSRRNHLGTNLADGTPVTTANYSERLQGFLIMLVSYLHTSEISYGRNDYEQFAKAYPPIVTHTRFRDMFHRILNSKEQKVFREIYGISAVRDKLYSLAGRSTGGGSRQLFPRRAVIQDEHFSSRPTWDDLVDKTLSDSALIDISGDEQMFTPLAGATDGPTRAGPKKFSVFDWSFGKKAVRREKVGARLELRRIGFNWVSSKRWRALTTRLHNMAKQLNK